MTRKTETEGDAVLSKDRVDKLRQRQAALQDELQALQARLAGAERKALDREKVLLGVGVQESIKLGLMDRAVMTKMLELLTPQDRAWMVERGWGVGGKAGHPKAAKPAAKPAGEASAA